MADRVPRSSVVCLLRSGDDEDDPYEQTLSAAGFETYSKPVLAFDFVNETALRDYLADPGIGDLVVTSPRASEAVLQRLQAEEALAARWRHQRAFVVGRRSGAMLESWFGRVEGADTGRAAALVAFIAQAEPQQPLLFVCGKRRREDVPTGLRARGIRYQECEAYRTRLRTDLAWKEPFPDWLVAFSPSGIEAVAQSPGVQPVVERAGWAAIGPTTAQALAERGWQPAAVAKAPTPEALRDALLAAHVPGT